MMTPQRARKRVRGRFDVAQTTDENRRHWANADSLSADAAARSEVRRVIRDRSRYEVANNSYAKGIVLTLANYVVGTGPRLQMLGGDSNVNAEIERQWSIWAREVQLAEKLRLMRMARAVDGESFMMLMNNLARPINNLTLDLRLFEAEQVATPGLWYPGGQRVDGIEFDAYNNPMRYSLLKVHPGDNRWGAASTEVDNITARFMIHYFRADRPGQTRGLPDILPALPLFALLRRYTLAVVSAAETAAEYAAVIESDTGADDGEQPATMDVFELERNMATVLPNGWKLGQLRAEQPTTTYDTFVVKILNEIARCLNMPLNIAMCNSAGYNYSSGRLDHQTFYRTIDVEQDDLEATVVNRIFDAWFAEGRLIPGYFGTFTLNEVFDRRHQWFWDGLEHVDPAKEANAQETRLRNQTTTLAYEYAKQGRDWEEALRQIAREQAMRKDLGLSVPEPAAQMASTDSEVDNAAG